MLKKIKSLMYQYSIPAAFIFFILIDLLLLGLGRLLSLLPPTLPIKYLNQSILIIVPVALVFFFGFSSAFKKGHFFRGLFCCLPFIALQLGVLVLYFAENLRNPEVNWNSWGMIIYGLFTVLGIGIREECIYRATLQNIVAKKYANSIKGIWITVIVGAVIFGTSHIPNLFFDMNPHAVLIQALSATVLGLLFGAVYLRSGSLWALILIHTLTDIAGLAPSTFLVGISDIDNLNQISWSWSKLILWLIYIGLTLFLLRPSKCKEIIATVRAESRT